MSGLHQWQSDDEVPGESSETAISRPCCALHAASGDSEIVIKLRQIEERGAHFLTRRRLSSARLASSVTSSDFTTLPLIHSRICLSYVPALAPAHYRNVTFTIACMHIYEHLGTCVCVLHVVSENDFGANLNLT